MYKGFGHFDGAYHENFISSALLLLFETNDTVRARVLRRIRALTGLPEDARLVTFGREAPLRVPGHKKPRRSDLWFRFEDGIVLVEAKTHPRWDLEHVRTQLEDQARSNCLLEGAPKVKGVLLLGPQPLAPAAAERFLSWGTLLSDIRSQVAEDALTKRVAHHLESVVETEVGFENGSIEGFGKAVRQLSCLRAFLQSCVQAIDGKFVEEELNLTRADGQPLSRGGWSWFGLSVPFKQGRTEYRLGIYEYTDAPAGERDAMSRLYLEAYPTKSDVAAVSLEFGPPSLAPAHLATVRESFVAEWTSPE